MGVLPFDVSKAIHTNLLIVWVLTGFMGATYWLVPEESRTELYSRPARLLCSSASGRSPGVTAVVGYLFGWTEGNKLLEQPHAGEVRHRGRDADVPLQHRDDDLEGEAAHDDGGRAGGRAWRWPRSCTCRRCSTFDNYTVSIYYRWWTVHLWVEGVWEMIQGGLLAYLLIRLSGADREVMEKWLYVIVGLTFIAGILGTAHHYFWIGVPRVLAAHRRLLQRAGAAGLPGHGDLRVHGDATLRAGAPEPAGAALDHRQRRSSRRSAPASSAWPTPGPSVNKWTHGTMITADARTHGLLRRLRDDRAGDDHLRHARAASGTTRRRRDRPPASGPSGCRWRACSA